MPKLKFKKLTLEAKRVVAVIFKKIIDLSLKRWILLLPVVLFVTFIDPMIYISSY